MRARQIINAHTSQVRLFNSRPLKGINTTPLHSEHIKLVISRVCLGTDPPPPFYAGASRKTASCMALGIYGVINTLAEQMVRTGMELKRVYGSRKSERNTNSCFAWTNSPST